MILSHLPKIKKIIYDQDIGMEFGMKKCAIELMKNREKKEQRKEEKSYIRKKTLEFIE